MADLPLPGRTAQTDKKEVPFTTEQRLDTLQKDIQEIARGVNTQGALLESIVVACNNVVQKYLQLTKITEDKNAPVEAAKPSAKEPVRKK